MVSRVVKVLQSRDWTDSNQSDDGRVDVRPEIPESGASTKYAS